MLWTEAANVNWMESLMWIFVGMSAVAFVVGMWRRLTGASAQMDRPASKAA